METMIALILLIIALFAAWVFCLLCKASGKRSQTEAKDNPCETCLRWDECNGVDEQCPRSGDDGKKRRCIYGVPVLQTG